MKVTLISFFSASFPVDFPTLNMPPGPPGPPMFLFTPLNMKTHMRIRRSGKSIQSIIPQKFSLFSITTLTFSSSGSWAFSSPNISSALKLPDTRKMKWGDFLGIFPPNRSEYFSILSGFMVIWPSNSFLMKVTSLMSPASHCFLTSSHSSF